MIHEPYKEGKWCSIVERYSNDRLNLETAGDCLVNEGKEFHVLITLEQMMNIITVYEQKARES